MLLFPVLRTLDAGLDPARCKTHLATSSGADDPLDVFRDNAFDEWQARQGRRNFERAQVVALIALPEPDRWLYAGAFDQRGSEPLADGDVLYDLAARPETLGMVGRLVVAFRRSGRQSYLNAERWSDQMTVAELRRERLTVGPFPGFSRVRLTHTELQRVVRAGAPSWRSALGSVAGVYVVADGATGRLYVGSATGADGPWSRWEAYAETGHGGNADLRRALQEHGADHARQFQYAVLETADMKAGADDVRAREEHWKRVLGTRDHGYNAN